MLVLVHILLYQFILINVSCIIGNYVYCHLFFPCLSVWLFCLSECHFFSHSWTLREQFVLFISSFFTILFWFLQFKSALSFHVISLCRGKPVKTAAKFRDLASLTLLFVWSSCKCYTIFTATIVRCLAGTPSKVFSFCRTVLILKIQTGLIESPSIKLFLMNIQ